MNALCRKGPVRLALVPQPRPCEAFQGRWRGLLPTLSVRVACDPNLTMLSPAILSCISEQHVWV
jgi:hypothetical protein